MTGAMLAPLGLGRACLAVFAGHLTGGLLLLLAGSLGGKYRRNAMGCTRVAFGERGGKFFAGLNFCQLLGWTAAVTAAGAAAAQKICPPVSAQVWIFGIAGMMMLWNVLGAKHLQVWNSIAVAALFILTLFAGCMIWGGKTAAAGSSATLSFGNALELSIAMPVSWLPLIADYTYDSPRPKLAGAVCASVYSVISCWMYLLGLGAALYAGSGNAMQVLAEAGWGLTALSVVIFSSVVTAFLDVYSSGMTMRNLLPRLSPEKTGAAVCFAGAALALAGKMEHFESFLYWIGSVFAPMTVVQIFDAWLGGGRHRTKVNLALWCAGFACYRMLLYCRLPCGSTVPTVIFTGILCSGVYCVIRLRER